MMHEFFAGLGLLIAYFLVAASSAVVLRRLIAMPREVFRKTLHVILLGSVFIFMYAYETWWVAAVTALAFIAVVFPILALAERLSFYSELLTERKRGEVKRSLVAAFGMYALLICTCWGWLGEKYLVIASVLAWGLGDAAAALVGKRFGRHHIEGRLIEGRKSIEGTVAMFAVSFVTVTIVLAIVRPVVWYAWAPVAFVTAAVCAVVELYTKGGMDTLTCPLAAALTLISLLRL